MYKTKTQYLYKEISVILKTSMSNNFMTYSLQNHYSVNITIVKKTMADFTTY